MKKSIKGRQVVMILSKTNRVQDIYLDRGQHKKKCYLVNVGNQVDSDFISGTGDFLFFLNEQFPASFYYFRLFNTVDNKQMFIIIFLDDWIRAVDLWHQKQLLSQLCHNNCPRIFVVTHTLHASDAVALKLEAKATPV